MSQTRELLDRETVLRTRLDRLEAGLRDHVGWLQEVNRVFVCRQSRDESDTASAAHLQCRFGRWVHAEMANDSDPDIAEIAQLHLELHDSVRDSLGRYKRGEELNVAAAEAMSGCALRFWNAVRALQSRIAIELAEPHSLAEVCAGGFTAASPAVPDNGNVAPQ